MKRSVLTISLLLACIAFSGCATPREETRELSTGTVTGQIMVKGGGPLSGGTVFFFSETSGPPPSATKYWRVPTDAFRIDTDGRFVAVLSEGNYYMGASKKLSGELLGPPQDRDFFFISQDEKQNPKLHSVRAHQTLDLGLISQAEPFSRKIYAKDDVTSIEGVIRDAKGTPVEGMLVFAFATPTMVGRPLFVSDRSDKNGNYLLRLYGGGTYYLRARVNYGGGPPAADQIMGIYKDGKPLKLKTGERVKGIDIKVTRVGLE